MFNAWLFAAAVIGYVLGSLPFGYLVARAHGVDIFKVGSGNPGATNVKRTLGAKAGNTVLVLDVLKGAAATGWPILDRAVTEWQWYYFPNHPKPDWFVMSLIGVVAAVIGHSFSLFTKFRGGKGVATAAGGLVVLMPLACGIAGVTWVVVFFAFRYVSLASLLAAVAVVAASWLLPYHVAISVIASVLGGFVILRHHENIRRLLNGTENKFAKKPPAQP
ncbi:MAG: glycerol-3-phosphate 1-O-acyltransferase PlsY [Opitutae bacterium]|nr:glycerol-3-phosphate 1-O-acyltransferase PlsY [Opitutae bacterium]